MTSRITETPDSTAAGGARALLSAAAVRKSSQRMLDLGLRNELFDWTVNLDRLPTAADFVAQVVRYRYPKLNPPLHARWRHFVFGGRDLWQEIAARTNWPNREARARAELDLVVTSVLLDAGAGSDWRYHDAASGLTLGRSEGLALASLRWFESGGLSSDAKDPLRVDASALLKVDARALNQAFQSGGHKPLLGTEGRVALLNRLGAAIIARPDVFAKTDLPRPGGIFDALLAQGRHNHLLAVAILSMLLDALGPIWQNRPSLDGKPLGDCWTHPAFHGPNPEDHFVPLHKLSQWLTYSLIEPLERSGLTIGGIDELTGLAEYRNGGLFVDMEVLVPRHPAAASRLHAVSSPLVVGWRSMTVALLDRIAPLIRERLGLSAAAFPLGCVLEGGTWQAGRQLAQQRRAGLPPFQISSDGTVF